MDQTKTYHQVKITAYDVAGNTRERIVKYPPVVNINTGAILS